MNANERYCLSDCELETVRRAAAHRGCAFDENRREYSGAELSTLGIVREGYNRPEMKNRGIVPRIVTSHDPLSLQAEQLMPIDTPFGSKIRKWQLPIDMMPIRVAKVVFPAGSEVSLHTHPIGESDNPGGGLRIVTKGQLEFEGEQYGPGDWFFVPNGVPYSFKTSVDAETEVMYTYAFFAAAEGNRFSHPFSA